MSTPVFVFKLVANPLHHGTLGIIRSLGRLGVAVHCNHETPSAPAASSRYAAKGPAWDPWPSNAREAVARLVDWGRDRAEPAILIPVDDAASLAVADHAAELRSFFVFPRPDASLARRLSSKLELAAMCEEHGIPTPRIAAPTGWEELDAVARRWGLPVVLKRIASEEPDDYEVPSVLIVHTPAELRRVWEKFESRWGFLAQEFVPGDSETVWMFNGYFDEAARCRSAFTGFKVRQYPRNRGATTLGECRTNPEVERLSIQLLESLGYRGIVDMGFRFDARDGRYKLLDVNPRIGATFRLFVAPSGADVARALYLDLTGQQASGGRPADGRRWLVEPYDLRSASGDWRALLGWPRALRSASELAWFSSDDPMPALQMIAACAARLRRAARARNHVEPAREVDPDAVRSQAVVDAHFERDASYWSDVYAGSRVESAVYRARRDRTMELIAALGQPAGTPALELGCGSGEISVRLARDGYTVTATDTVDAMLERTRLRLEAEGLPVDVRRADAHDLHDFAEGSFGLVVGLGVLPWLHSPESAVREISRVLRPDAFVVLSVDNARRLNELLDPGLTWTLAPARTRLREWLRAAAPAAPGAARPRRHRPREVDSLLRAAGLEPISDQTIGFGPVTFLYRPVAGGRVGLAVNDALQRWADSGVPLVRHGGVHHLLLARKPEAPGPAGS